MKFAVLIAIIQDKDEEKAIEVAKGSGAGGVTIIHGRNIGLKEKKVFFGLTLEENVSILMFLLPKRTSLQVMKSLRTEFDLDNPENSGVTFTIPLSHLAGLDREELHKFEKDVKNML